MNSTAPDQPKPAQRPRAAWPGYAAAALALALATVLRVALDPVLGEHVPLITYLGAVALVAWSGRTGPAVVTLVVGGILSFHLFAPEGMRAWWGIALYLLVGAVIVTMSHAMRHARRRAEQLLAEAVLQQQAREEMAATLESVLDGFIRYDRDWRMVYVNAAAERINHFRREDVIGRTVWELFPAVLGTPIESEFRRAVAEQVTVEFENFYEPWGRWYALKGYPTEDGGLTTFIRDITEQKAQRDALVASEARFREQADAMPQMVYSSNADGRVDFANRQWRDYTGQAEAQTADLAAVVHPDDLPTIVQQWETAQATGTPLQAAFRLRRAADGAYRWFLTRSVPVRDASGRVVKWYGTSTDIDDQKRTEQQLAESEARYRAIGESIDFGVWVCDAQGRNTYASDSFLRRFGLTQQQCSDFGWGDVLHPDDVDGTIAAWQECVRSNGHWDRVHRCRGVDGQWYSVLARGVPLRNPAGDSLGWAGINLDITHLVQTERELARLSTESERQRRLYETVLTNTPDFMYVFSLDHKVLYANEALIHMWGCSRDGAIGRTFLEIGYEPWHAAMHDQEIDQVRATRQSIRGQVPFTGTDGRRQYEYIFVPVIGADGEVEAVAGTTRDITDRVLAEERLKANEARQTFLVALADAIRPLSDPAAVQAEASRLLGERLAANRVVYFEVVGGDYVIEREYVAGVRPLAGRYPVGSFGPSLLAALQEGRTTVEADALDVADRSPAECAAFAAIDVRGHVDVPLVKGGRFVAGLTVHDTGRRDWAAHELAMIEDTAERTWAAVERVRVEAELHRSEERSAFVRRSSGVGFWYCDLPFDVLQWDELVKAHFHLPPDAHVTIQTFYERIHPDDREPTRRAIERSIREHVHYEVDYRTVHPDSGALTWVRAIGRTFYAADGTPTRFDGVTLDVSQQKRAEQRLRESEERRRLALDAAELGTWHIDAATLTPTTDERFRSIFSGSTDAMDHEQVFAAIHPADRDHIRAAMDEAMSADGQAPYAQEYRVLHRDGSVHWVSARGRANFDRGGKPRLLSFNGTVADITERKLIEQERERLVGQLREADRRKDEFIATLAHELRNPLAPIRNGLQLIRMIGSSGAVEQARSMMERQLVQLTRLVDDLLDVSRLTTGKLELRRERVELCAVIDAALETSRPVIELEGHRLSVQHPDDPLVVDGDPIRLAQVISNLLNNSAKYTPTGGLIRVSVVRDAGQAVVAVADNGIGIPADMLARVFDMFTQVDRTLEKTTGGLGIGLSLVKGLVQMHGGTIEARSDGPGRGSEFALRLPLAGACAVPSDRSAGQAPGAEPPKRHRVLIVDDNVDFADSLGQMLALLGHEVRTAYDGHAGVIAAQAFRPAVVLCDIGMPKLNGYDAARRIRAQARGERTVLVALTGWGQGSDLAKSEAAGFDHHLVKPVEPAALIELFASLPTEAA